MMRSCGALCFENKRHANTYLRLDSLLQARLETLVLGQRSNFLERGDMRSGLSIVGHWAIPPGLARLARLLATKLVTRIL